MGIKISAIFLMTILIAGFSSFPSSISNSSTELVDQTNSLNLINMAFAASDEEEKAADRAEKAADKAADRAEKAADKAADRSEKAVEKAADRAEKAAEKAADRAEKAAEKAADIAEKAAEKAADRAEKELEKDYDIQEFNSATVVHMSGTTTICHVPPGNPSSAHFITIGKPAVSAHDGHGDFDVLGLCAENGIENIMSNKEIYQAQKLTAGFPMVIK